jgi:hypothetical protein
MKVSKFISVKDVEGEIEEEKREAIKAIAKRQIKDIRDAKRTLARMQLTHKVFMNADVDEIEDGGMEW